MANEGKSLWKRAQPFCSGCECYDTSEEYPGDCSIYDINTQGANATRNYCTRMVGGKKVTWSKDSSKVDVETYESPVVLERREPLTDKFGEDFGKLLVPETYKEVTNLVRVSR